MPAADYDLTIEAGSTFKLNVTWTNPDGSPIDMTGYQVRATFLAAGTDVIVLDVNSATPITGITVSTPDSTGVVDITVEHTITAALSGVGRYVFEATSSADDASRLLEGTFVVSPGVPA